MNFSKFAKPVSKSISKASISPDDFELLLESFQTAGDFYMGRALSSIYWNAVIGVYNAVKNQFGEHADTYIAMMEVQKAESAEVVYWLHASGFRPDADSGNDIASILDFVHDDFDVETETLLVISENIRELKKHNQLMTARMPRDRALREFKLLPAEVQTDYQAIIDNRVASQEADQQSAVTTVLAMFQSDKNVSINDLSPHKIYTLVSKLDGKVSDWITVEEDKKFKASLRNDSYMVGLTGSTLELLDVVQSMASKLVKEADEVEQTNTSEEITTSIESNPIGLNDQTDSQGVNQYNGGYNIA